MTASVNYEIAGGGVGGEGGTVSLDTMTSAASSGTDNERTAFLTAVGAAEYKAPVTVNTDFTLLAEDHANRYVYATKGTAQAITFNSGHGLVNGDNGRIVQVGAGAVTISKDGGFAAGELKLATGVSNATTVNDGDVIDWEYQLVGAVERLSITFRSAAASGASGITVMATANDQSVSLTGGEDVLTSFTLPANSLGANGFAEFITYMDRTSGANSWVPRLRLGNATTGMVIGSLSTVTSRSTWRSSFANLGAANSQISGAVGTTTANDVGTSTPSTGGVDTTANVTIYLTVQGTAAEVVRCRYLRGTAIYKD